MCAKCHSGANSMGPSRLLKHPLTNGPQRSSRGPLEDLWNPFFEITEIYQARAECTRTRNFPHPAIMSLICRDVVGKTPDDRILFHCCPEIHSQISGWIYQSEMFLETSESLCHDCAKNLAVEGVLPFEQKKILFGLMRSFILTLRTKTRCFWNTLNLFVTFAQKAWP